MAKHVVPGAFGIADMGSTPIASTSNLLMISYDILPKIILDRILILLNLLSKITQ